MKIIVAIDSFKGCLSSLEAGQAVAGGLKRLDPAAEIDVLQVSDGGEGMLDAFMSAVGGTMASVEVHDPLMRLVTARYGVSGRTAVVEVAQACGLSLVEPELRCQLTATSYGVGEILVDAIRRGCREFIVGLGGSGVTDGGVGMLRALVDNLSHGGRYCDICRLLSPYWFTIATDVRNPLCGPTGAARVFAPQKGASREEVVALEAKLACFAEESARNLGYDRSCCPGAGAAGGLGYAFMQYLGAERRGGADLLFDLLQFDRRLSGASLVVTGEGSADGQTLMGKLPFAVMSRASLQGVQTAIVAGRVADEVQLFASGFRAVVGVTPPSMPLCEAMRPDVARHNIESAVVESLPGVFPFLVG